MIVRGNGDITLIQGDCLDVMPLLGPWFGKFDLTVTSPPYDNLRTYDGTLDWCEKIWCDVIRKLWNLTKPGCTVVWVVGDATVKGSETGTAFKQAIFAMEVGFKLHDTMIFEKHHFANPSHNRYHQIFDYMFIFSKNKLITFNPIKDKPIKYGKPWGQSKVTLANGVQEDRSQYQSKNEFGNRVNIFKYTVSKGCYSSDNQAVKHPASFPLQLAIDHILTWSNVNDIVVDPFMGSGTTGVACQKTGRKFVGIEKNPSYFKIACERIGVSHV